MLNGALFFARELPPGLYATFHTSMGKIFCELYPDKAPKTVKSFVGLATGKQKWINMRTGKVSTLPLYNSGMTVF